MVIGIICEYNPPHRGHAYQLSVLRARYPDSTIVCVMSGSFTQRGTPAVAGKYARARAALALGADAVLELPFPYSCAPAELFARGGVGILAALGADTLCFGTEGDVCDALCSTAERLDGGTFAAAMTEAMENPANRGTGYSVMRERVYASLYGDAQAALLRTPNNTLGVEYLRAIRYYGADMTPITVPRTGDAHDAPAADTELPAQSRIVSASAVRALLGAGRFADAAALLPEVTAEMLHTEAAAGHLCTDPDSIPGPLLLHTFRTQPAEQLAQYAGLGGGLSQRLCAASFRAHTVGEWYALAATKKYTNAAIRRAALAGMFGITEEEQRNPPSYTVLLAANRRASAFLRRASKENRLPVISRPAAYLQMPETIRRAFERGLAADAVYGMLLPSPLSHAELLAAVPYTAQS